MERAIEANHAPFEETIEPVKIPRPRPNGTDTLEDLGHWVNRLVGGERDRRQAAAELEPLYEEPGESMPEPEPIEVPKAQPRGTESFKGGRRRT